MKKVKEEYDYSLLINKINEKYYVHRQLAKKLGLTDVQFSNLIRGRKEFTRDLIEKFAVELDIRPSQYHIYFFKKKVPVRG